MSRKFNLYLGKAGQLTIMSEFLARGWNVAMPEVDVGDDIFVVEDKTGIFYRIQVKTATAVERQKMGFSAQFRLSVQQIEVPISPEIYFVFIARFNQKWTNSLVISRETLWNFVQQHKIGSIFNDNLMLYFSFQNDKATCSNIDFSEFLNNFDDFPIIEH